MKRLFVIFFLFVSTHLQSQTWRTVFEGESPVGFTDVLRTRGDAYLFAGQYHDAAWLVKFEENGEYVSRRFPEIYTFMGVEELDNGNYFVIGAATIDSISNLCAAVVDNELNIIKNTFIAVEEDYESFYPYEGQTMKDSDGTIVASVPAVYEEEDGWIHHWGTLWRFDQEGELSHHRYLGQLFSGHLARFWPYQIKKTYDDQEICLFVPCRDGFSDMLYFDESFNCLRAYQMMVEGHPIWDWFSDWYYDNGDMLATAQVYYPGVYNIYQLLFFRMTAEGEIVEQNMPIRIGDTCMYGAAFRGMAAFDENTVYVGAYCLPEGGVRPCYPEVFLINKDLEVLGKISLESEWNYWTNLIVETSDGGCILSAISGDSKKSIVLKFTREDFNPILSVKDVPCEQLEACAFPSPTRSMLNIDISDIPHDEANRIRVIDANGRVCIDRYIKGEGNLLELGVGCLRPGLYVYQIYNAQQELLKGKFVKE